MKDLPPVPLAITPAVLESVQYLVNRLLTAFPATPKFTSPDPGGFWGVSPWFDPIIGPTFVGMVGIKTNKTAVAHRLTALDLTDPTIIVPPVTIPVPPVTTLPSTFWTYFGAGALVRGHDYRLRIEIDPAVANPNDEFDTVYVTLI
jgi:hypothetical protein